jgi:pimeloyl-ACP methyl ester carboxylesterase
MPPRTQYTKSCNVSIAYQVIGEGPIDLVYASGWLSNVEYAWENPDYARFLRRLASFSRLIVFDKRGTGLSDRDVGLSTLEQRVDDIRAVMDAAGSEGAALLGVSEGVIPPQCAPLAPSCSRKRLPSCLFSPHQKARLSLTGLRSRES